jgi:hypothetical protein
MVRATVALNWLNAFAPAAVTGRPAVTSDRKPPTLHVRWTV